MVSCNFKLEDNGNSISLIACTSAGTPITFGRILTIFQDGTICRHYGLSNRLRSVYGLKLNCDGAIFCAFLGDTEMEEGDDQDEEEERAEVNGMLNIVEPPEEEER